MRPPVNVVYIRDHLVPGGGTASLLNTLPRFDPRRIVPSLCVLQPRNGTAQDLEAAGVPTLCIGRRKLDPRCLLNARAWVQARRPELLVLSGSKSLVIGGLLAKLLALPTSPLFNNMIADSTLMTLMQRRLSSTTAIAVAVSRAVRDWACARYRLPTTRVEVVYGGHDVARYGTPPPGAREAIRTALGLAPRAPVIALIGRLVTAQKGQDVMIRAMPALIRARPNAALIIVGDGSDRVTLDVLTRELGHFSGGPSPGPPRRHSRAARRLGYRCGAVGAGRFATHCARGDGRGPSGGCLCNRRTAGDCAGWGDRGRRANRGYGRTGHCDPSASER